MLGLLYNTNVIIINDFIRSFGPNLNAYSNTVLLKIGKKTIFKAFCIGKLVCRLETENVIKRVFKVIKYRCHNYDFCVCVNTVRLINGKLMENKLIEPCREFGIVYFIYFVWRPTYNKQ